MHSGAQETWVRTGLASRSPAEPGESRREQWAAVGHLPGAQPPTCTCGQGSARGTPSPPGRPWLAGRAALSRGAGCASGVHRPACSQCQAELSL